MKTKLIFEHPDDNYDLWCAQHGHELLRVIDELDNWLRGYTKHGDPKDVDAETCREKLWELRNEYINGEEPG